MPAIIALDNVTVSHARESFTQQQRMFAKMGLSYRKKSSIMGTSLHPGHTALRKGRVSIANTAYLVTATTFDRVNHFENFAAACAAARCFENIAVLRDNRLLAWVLMPDHAHWLLP